MPKENQDGQEKTEKPSARRVQKTREEGNVAQSKELSSFAVLLAGLSAMTVFGSWMLNRIMSLYVDIYRNLNASSVNPDIFGEAIKYSVTWLMITVSPVLVTVVILSLISSYLQIGWLWSTKSLKPKFDRMNIVSGFKRLFNQRSLVTLVINITKLVAIAIVAYIVVKKAWPMFFPMMDTSVGAIYLFITQTIFKVAVWTLSLLFLIAMIDFIYQKWKHTEEIKMTKQELKDERKMSEGDPKLKARIRQVQFQLAFNTMIKELPEADVIITNPTHVAVALRYDVGNMAAPKVIGKGLRKLAEKIKKIAREHDIPIVENPPLARSLYYSCNIGDEIPGQFYQDVAEILAHIYRLREEVSEA